MSWFSSKKQEAQIAPEVDEDDGPLYLWLIEQSDNNGYDTYSGAVVVAASRREAKQIHPQGNSGADWYYSDYRSWTDPENVKATKLGPALPRLKAGTVVLASFHAG